MSKNKITLENFKDIVLNRKKLIDVRAPVEFAQGHIPGAVNLPILDNDERKHIGTTYKQQGREKAIEIGYRLVSGENKETKLRLWKEFVKANPDAVLYCFRGGLRSQITQQWLEEAGICLPLIDGGYKAFRHYLLEELARVVDQVQLIPISGVTGSFKTHLLQKLSENQIPIVDLEQIANHRGSSFGKLGPQPAQAQFENQVAYNFILHAQQKQIYIEDESRLIGTCVVPDVVFKKIRESSIIWIEENIESRAQNILQDYVIFYLKNMDELSDLELKEKSDVLFDNFEKSLVGIKTKLGGLRFQEILADMKEAKSKLIEEKDFDGNLVWIVKLLKYYYDPMYEQSISKRNPNVIFKGNFDAIFKFISGT
jgi:tRNA 2-selenouridine synthase